MTPGRKIDWPYLTVAFVLNTAALMMTDTAKALASFLLGAALVTWLHLASR